jgi:2-C-methyl-D-erythritol 4-phosphate cytidylyltransferase/2-C-methyl-D-erythritol 2,4-cyclodiphosphate synthase
MHDPMTTRADAVVAAAGASRRMAGEDKLLAPLLGRPLLAWTVGALRAAASIDRIVVAVEPRQAEALGDAPWMRAFGATVVAGGPRRQETVAAGVAATRAALVLVHDGARPLASPALIDAVARGTAAHGAVVPVVPVAETLKRVDGGRVAGTVDRTALAAAQTPQGVRRDLLEAAWERFDPAGPREFTDEASLLEAAGISVVAIPGETTNLKVTLPADLERAAAWLSARSGPARTGVGTDEHPFGPGHGLALGGIAIPDAPRLLGHSDGDAVLHAIADALLGAAALGDLGRHFPAGDPATRGAPSSDLLRAVVGVLASGGWAPAAIDVTIRAARPRLGAPRLEAMRDAIAGMLGLATSAVAVKASTGNLIGYEGAGRGIAATAIATVVRR